MGLWSKGVSRSMTGQKRLEDEKIFFIPPHEFTMEDLIKDMEKIDTTNMDTLKEIIDYMSTIRNYEVNF